MRCTDVIGAGCVAPLCQHWIESARVRLNRCGSSEVFTRVSAGHRPRGDIPALSPFLNGRICLREPSWKYSAKLVGS